MNVNNWNYTEEIVLSTKSSEMWINTPNYLHTSNNTFYIDMCVVIYNFIINMTISVIFSEHFYGNDLNNFPFFCLACLGVIIKDFAGLLFGWLRWKRMMLGILPMMPAKTGSDFKASRQRCKVNVLNLYFSSFLPYLLLFFVLIAFNSLVNPDDLNAVSIVTLAAAHEWHCSCCGNRSRLTSKRDSDYMHETSGLLLELTEDMYCTHTHLAIGNVTWKNLTLYTVLYISCIRQNDLCCESTGQWIVHTTANMQYIPTFGVEAKFTGPEVVSRCKKYLVL